MGFEELPNKINPLFFHLVPFVHFEKSTLLQVSEQEEQELSDVNDAEYNKTLDDVVKTDKTLRQKILEAARRLESL